MIVVVVSTLGSGNVPGWATRAGTGPVACGPVPVTAIASFTGACPGALFFVLMQASKYTGKATGT